MKPTAKMSVSFALMPIVFASFTLPVFGSNGSPTVSTNSPSNSLSNSAVPPVAGIGGHSSSIPHPTLLPKLPVKGETNRCVEAPAMLSLDSLTNVSFSAHALPAAVCCLAKGTLAELDWRPTGLTIEPVPTMAHKTLRFLSDGALLSIGKPDWNPERRKLAPLTFRRDPSPVGHSWAGQDYAIEPEGLRLFSWRW